VLLARKFTGGPFALALLLGLAACDAGPGTATGTGDITGSDSNHEADSTASSADADERGGDSHNSDSTASSADADEKDVDSHNSTGPAPAGPVFEIGTNLTGANTPDSFALLHDGDELEVELGFQGLWMVVLAFRTRDIFQGTLTIITRIKADGVTQGELGMGKQKLHPGGNDLDYYYNLFLVVLDPSVGGLPAQITLSVTDEAGTEVEEALEVQLTGGQVP